DHEMPVEPPHIDFPEPVMSFAVSPRAKGDEEKMATGLRRLSEEDPTLLLRRDPQTGEQLLSGLSQMQVEVAVDRLRSRFHVDVELHPPRVPYKETIRKEARARHRYKKQTGDSSEMPFKIAGSMAFKDAYAKAEPVLLEPIMELEVTVPDDSVGAVNGDLNSRRGRLQGMEPAGGMTKIRAEVPMAEILT